MTPRRPVRRRLTMRGADQGPPRRGTEPRTLLIGFVVLVAAFTEAARQQ